jgi:hypothetical protein
MASMSTEIAVLRALLRLSRRRAPATFSDLVDRVVRDHDATAADVQRALTSFARAELVVRSGERVRLSLAGLAVAVAAVRHAACRAQASRRAKTVASPRTQTPERVSPVARIGRAVRRHRAA